MKRVVAGAALALAAVPLAPAAALPPPQHRAVACTREHVVSETDLQRYLVCLNRRDGGTEHAVECFRQYVIRADPVPRTPEEYVAATVRDAERTVRFATCVAEG